MMYSKKKDLIESIVTRYLEFLFQYLLKKKNILGKKGTNYILCEDDSTFPPKCLTSL